MDGNIFLVKQSSGTSIYREHGREVTESTWFEADRLGPDMGRFESGYKHCVQETEYGQSEIHEVIYVSLQNVE